MRNIKSHAPDALALLMAEIAKIPRLSHEEEIVLARQSFAKAELLKARRQGTLQMDLSEQVRVLCRGLRATEKLVESNLPLVVSMAKKYAARGVELLDLIQEGAIGLQRAVENFDPYRGYRLSTYAYPWIRQGISRALRLDSRAVRLGQKTIKKLGQVHRATEELTRELGSAPTQRELAHWLGMSGCQLSRLWAYSRETVSLDMKLPSGSEEGGLTLADTLADQEEPEEEIHAALRREELEFHFRFLSPEELEIITDRYGLGGKTPLSFKEIARRRKMSPYMVRRLAWRARHKLRTNLCLLYGSPEEAIQNLL
jgi:RNA polymerase primary sigma factor